MKSYKQVDLVVCEPTGGHERLVLEEGLRTSMTSPSRRYAQAQELHPLVRHGQQERRHRCRACSAGAYGRERWQILPLWQTPDPNEERLRALVRRRQELIAIKGAEQNRAKAPAACDLTASFEAMIEAVEHQILPVVEAAMRGTDHQEQHAAIRRASPCAPP